jgi:DNA-binding XRE family transcriptional regulator
MPTGTVSDCTTEGNAMATAGQRSGASKPKPSPRKAGRHREYEVTVWGKMVESLAAKHGMDRQRLADAAGIAYPSLWALLVGASKPKFETACKLADVLGVSVDKIRQ